MRKISTQAFTLIELSIVLVVIGLIAAGVVAGKNLIDNARLMQVMTEAKKYRTAVQLFTDANGRFPGGYMPGDRIDAWQSWNKGPAVWTELNTGGFTTSTAYVLGAVLASFGNTKQGYPTTWVWWYTDYFIYNQVGNVPTYPLTIGSNVYPSAANQPMMLILNAPWRWAADSFLDAVMTPNQSYRIDLKMDDGLPTKGKVLGYDAGTCISSGAYSVNDVSPGCFMIFTQ